MGTVLVVDADETLRAQVRNVCGASQPTAALSTRDALARLRVDPGALDAVIVGPAGPYPVELAQQASVADPDMAVLLLCEEGRFQELRRALQFSPLMGDSVRLAVELQPEALTQALTATRERRSYRTAIKSLNRQLQVARPGLHAATAHLGQVLEYMPVGVVAIDGAGAIQSWNPRAEQLFGKTEREVLGQPFVRLLERGAAAQTFEALRRLPGKGPHIGTLSVTRAGQRCELELTVGAMAGPDDDGQLVLVQDITARAESERRVERAAAKARFLSEAGRKLSRSLDLAATLQELARLVVPELADWSFVDVATGEGHDRIAVAHADPAQVALAQRFRRRYPRAPGRGLSTPMGGTPLLISTVSDALLASVAVDDDHLEALRALAPRSVVSVPLSARGRVLGALTLIHAASGRVFGEVELAYAQELADRAAVAIDNARLYEEAQAARAHAEQANRAKDEFLAVVSHELRTPLTAILGYVTLVRSGRAGEAVRERAIEVIERNARAQAQLVDDILDVARIITGKVRLVVEPIQLHGLVAAALETVQPAARARQIALHATLQPEVAAISGDAERLQQVIWNLLTNAIKFTPPGGRIEVTLAQVEDQVELVVSDNGKGISPTFLPHVFDQFRQADSSSTRSHGGLGLGLAIAKHLVELHGGTIEAQSAGEGRGSRFAVRLPAAHSDLAPQAELQPKPAAPRSKAWAPPPELVGLRVLVVEDDADTRGLLTEILAQCQAQVVAVGSAAAARAALATSKVDLLVSDIGMPGEDGYALIETVRKQGLRLPAVALTAFSRMVDRTRALSAGFNVHVPKPVDADELVLAITALLRARP